MKSSRLLILGFILSSVGAAVHAQTFTWGTITGTNLWTDGANWVGGTPPADGGNADYTLVFTNPATGISYMATNDFGTLPFLVNELIFNNARSGGGSNIVLSGGALQLSSSSGGNAPRIVQNGVGTFIVNNNLNLAANTYFVGSTSATGIFNGVISGSGAMIKSNAWMVRIVNNTAPSHAGGTEIYGGTIVWVYSGATLTNSFGNGVITLNGGTFTFDASGTPANQTTVLTNAIVVNNVGTIGTASSTGKTFIFSGGLTLNGHLSFGVLGGGGGGGPGGVYAGTITLDQGAAGTRQITLISGGNHGPTITGNIVDGAGGAGNPLILRSGDSGNGRAVVIAGLNNTYAGGTEIVAPVSGSQRIVVDANAVLGTGYVRINAGTLEFRSEQNLNAAHSIITNHGNFVYGYQSGVTTSRFVFSGTGTLVRDGGGVVILTNANPLTGGIRINTALLGVSDMSVLAPGNLNLIGGQFLLDGTIGGGKTWTNFVDNRPAGFGAGANQWQISGSTGGFAARNTKAVIDAYGTTPTTFDRNFALGNVAKVGGLLYANAGVEIAQDINLSASISRTVTVFGAVNEATNRFGYAAWLLDSPVNEISGQITGGAAGRTFVINGNGNANNAQGIGGILRLSNINNSYVATNRINIGGGNLVVIATDDRVFGDPSNLVILGSGANGPDALVLFEDQTGLGKYFGRPLTLDTGDSSSDSSGFGAFGGHVIYTGIVNRVDTGTAGSIVVYAHHGAKLTLGDASNAATLNYTARDALLYKQGAGEVVLSNFVQVTGIRTQTWILREGTLTTTKDPSATGNPDGGQLRTAGGIAWNNLASAGNVASTNIHRWAIRDNSQTYTNMTSGSFSGSFIIDVGAGLTLRTVGDNTVLTPIEGAAVNDVRHWDMIKQGDGTWVYWNNRTSFTSGGRNNVVRVDDGIFDVTGDMGRGGVALNGGTVLSGTFSPFTGDGGGTQRFRIDAGGGKLGISPTATGNVVRAAGITSWNQTAPQTVTFAARDDFSLIFNTAITNIAPTTHLRIERDGSGTGVVRIANATLTVAGTLSGSGALRLGAAGTGTLILTNGATFSPGSSPGIFSVEGNLTLGDGSILKLELNGTTAGSQHDQVSVLGNVTLDNPTLSLSFGYVPVFGDSFLVLNKQSAGSISGTFNGLAEGDQFIAGGYLMQISYLGGDGNDVLLTVVPEPSAIALVGLGLVGLLVLRRRR